MRPIKWGQIKKEQWILLLLAGILIMTIFFPSEQSAKRSTEITAVEETEAAQAEEENLSEIALYEKKLETLLSGMEGAGKVKVMITETVSRERQVEKDEESTVYERDSQGRETPYVSRSIAPKIEGVLVLAQGGENAVVAKNITDAVVALFGIEAHKIKVMKMV